jgi:diguanylate cyclase (GGDEF)-like protein
VAEVLKATARGSDSISRYGGEEFAVLLPGTTTEGALHLSEKLRAAVEKLRVIVPDSGVALSVTVSVGVSCFTGDKREFFNAADRALYTSKAAGKNRVHHEIAGA